ncbi:MAG: M20/M25/M40 family metallo-hydrolase [Candidatus Shapirobacteria bacterium]
MQNILDLTKKLVSIPSWVDGETNEILVADFIFDYLQNNSKLKLTKELVVNGRYNILAGNSEGIDTLLCGHMDTVGVDLKSWNTTPTTPTEIDGKLYGRGTTDMKSGVAAMMLLACQKNLPNNIGFLFYIDEEFAFLGINKFIADYGDKIKPRNIICLDGSELEIANGCRGLIEVQMEIIGKSCHAGTPENGISAIDASYKIYQKLKEYLSTFNDPELRTTSINLGLISGGSAPNLVAGNCKMTLDIRPSVSAINGKLITDKLNEFANSKSVKIENLKINFDFGSWITPKKDLEKFGLPFKNIRKSGYFDTQLLWQKFDKPISFTIGAGCQATAHTSNEFIEIEKLNKLPQILQDIINKI